MKSLIILITIFYVNYLYALPSEVFIIRHAEKEKGSNTLSAKGYQRANAYVQFFTNSNFTKKYGIPDAIFAARPKDDDSSIRSIETVTPLAHKLNLKLRTEYIRDEFDLLALLILKNSELSHKKILISWPHNRIVDIALKLGVEESGLVWSDKVFDRVWVLKYSDDQLESFEDLPEKLLPGDSEI